MPILRLTDEQVVDVVRQLPPERKRTARLAVAEEALARGLAGIVQRDSFSDADVEAGLRGVAAILPQVSDCDGLSIFMEMFEPAVLDRISEGIRSSREAALPLLTWASTVRERQV